MSFTIFFLLSYILLSISLYFLFEKCGESKVSGLIPGLNFVVWCRLIGRKPTHALFLLFPIVNIFIYAGMAIDMVRSFKRYTFWESVLAVLFTPFFFLYLARNEKETYDGPAIPKEKAFREELQKVREAKNTRALKKLEESSPYRKSAIREWAEAIIFAVFAAAFIRMFLIEAYVIPTSSMEGSLMVGDFLFVSKPAYGLRLPQTVAMIPLLHNRIPYIDRESYLRNPSLAYKRLPALTKIDHNSPVVFNYPEGDSVYIFPERTWSVYDYRRGSIPSSFAGAIQSGLKQMTTRPMDKMDHYIKRCIGLPGDHLEIRDRQVYIDGKAAVNPKNIQFVYKLIKNPSISFNTVNFAKWGISAEDYNPNASVGDTSYIVLNAEQKEKVLSLDKGIKIDHIPMPKGSPGSGNYFPYDRIHFPDWTLDNYGSIYIPQKGATIKISPANIALYRRVISVYEKNKLLEKGDKIYINGKEATQYTFKQNYYWMMGDNRHNSEDSRYWGFVPEDHVVGRPLLIWFSLNEGKASNGINWKRVFTLASNK